MVVFPLCAVLKLKKVKIGFFVELEHSWAKLMIFLYEIVKNVDKLICV